MRFQEISNIGLAHTTRISNPSWLAGHVTIQVTQQRILGRSSETFVHLPSNILLHQLDGVAESEPVHAGRGPGGDLHRHPPRPPRPRSHHLSQSERGRLAQHHLEVDETKSSYQKT